MQDLERRVARAERNQRLLGLALAVVLVGGIGLAAAPQNDTWEGQKIVLKHPDGGSTITLSASANSSGIWIGDQKQGRQYDVALVDSANGPSLLMASKDGKFCGIAPSDGNKANADQDGRNLFRFYTANVAGNTGATGVSTPGGARETSTKAVPR